MDRAEKRLHDKYLKAWLQAMNNPELYRTRAIVIRDVIDAIRGELTDAA